MKKVLIFLSFIMIFTGCSSTYKGVKEDSKEAWDSTKKVSKEVWNGTKEVASEIYDDTKKAISSE
ncbi:hypothetical protein [Arcobacter vandammei]|uniref:hypothetical protein n=1 Tax=Arcobacter vandammei TaxID=2782243 RepID=UPI0018DFE466|nr:hypothetical protein [Arcobacter vandammei]